MTFVIRHPILILSIIGTCVLSYLVYAKATEEQVRNDFRRGYGNNAPLVGLTKVVVKVIADDLESVGTTVANESVNLTAAVSETISRVAFEDGEFVERGDILVELTSTAEASRLAEAQANVDDAKRQLDRLENLSANNLVADNEFDQARTALETAKARLKGVLVDMDDRLVRAPFSGYLGFRNVSEGSLLTPGSVITTLDDVSKIKLDFSIPEIYLADIAVGQTIKAKSIVYEERDFEAEITVVGSRIDPVTRGVAVRAQINNNELLLRPGMLMTVSLALNEESVMVVPESAVIASQGIQFVYRVDADNKVLRKQVELGRRREGQVEIRDGLDPGDRVVSDGVIRVRPGI
ncbi:MAG: efflux RND transporter periplasmic adaptor subunit, partial [Gammaproteobacteria bacterium]|nr:efflux RND transporter periplasmic adaptor subunit [Gammaproteobacteria bacterium]